MQRDHRQRLPAPTTDNGSSARNEEVKQEREGQVGEDGGHVPIAKAIRIKIEEAEETPATTLKEVGGQEREEEAGEGKGKDPAAKAVHIKVEEEEEEEEPPAPTSREAEDQDWPAVHRGNKRRRLL
ncbi:hypothetical protein MMC11_008402 [Xylographa trunciseda]|nr:hypothetical protein [Xylographa trunciseda]